MGNYSKTAAGAGPRTELHDLLGLTGAEISVNSLPEGAGVPFVHYHKENEEIYYIIEGKGKAVIDGDETDIVAGDFIRIAPAAERQFKADDSEGITYICIQVKAGSLEHYTAEDAVIIPQE